MDQRCPGLFATGIVDELAPVRSGPVTADIPRRYRRKNATSATASMTGPPPQAYQAYRA